MTTPYRTLLVDNHSLIRSGLALLFNATPDFTVVGETGSGEDALLLVHELRPDVVVIDLSMPGMGGLELIRAVHLRVPSTRTTVLTRFSDRFHVRQAFDAGATAYVLKSSPPARILDALRAAVRGDTFLDPALRLPEPEDGPRPDSAARVRVAELTPRELDVLRATAAGASSKEIAARLDLSTRTVEFHKYNGMRRLALRGRAALLTLALREGWLNDNSPTTKR